MTSIVARLTVNHLLTLAEALDVPGLFVATDGNVPWEGHAVVTHDGMDAARAFGIANIGLPFTAFTDSSGRIATIHVGELHRPQAEVILALVREVDAGTIDMAAARAQIREKLSDLGHPAH